MKAETTALDVFMADIEFPEWVRQNYDALTVALTEARQTAENYYHQDVTHLRMLQETQARLATVEEALRKAIKLIELLPHKHSCNYYYTSHCNCGRNEFLTKQNNT